MEPTLPRAQIFPADFSALGDVRAFVQRCAEDEGLDPDVTHDLLVAVTEAGTDMLAHERGSFMSVGWWLHEGTVVIQVKDEGVPAGPMPIVELPDAEERFGFPYILAFVDEVDVRPGTTDHPGTKVKIVKDLAAALD